MRKMALAALAATMLCGSAEAAPSLVVDQASSGVGDIGVTFGAQAGESANDVVGQTFSPSLALIDFVTLRLGYTDFAHTVLVTLYQGTYAPGAAALAVATPVVVPAARAYNTYEFDFATSIALTPNSLYSFTVTKVPDGIRNNFIGAVTSSNDYTRGNLIRASVPEAGDLLFSEGVFGPAATVPEPASWAMIVGGFGLVGAAMRRRKVAVSFA